jgi:hypothetical protein
VWVIDQDCEVGHLWYEVHGSTLEQSEVGHMGKCFHNRAACEVGVMDSAARILCQGYITLGVAVH